MYTFNGVACGVTLVGVAVHLFFFARIAKGSHIRDTRTRLIALMESLSYIVSMVLLFLAVWVPLRHHNGDTDNRFLLPAFPFMLLPNLYSLLKKRFSDDRTESVQTPDAK